MKTFARRVSVLLLCLLMACVSGCESADDGQSTGHGDGLLTVSLAYSGGGWFRLQIFAPHPDHPGAAGRVWPMPMSMKQGAGTAELADTFTIEAALNSATLNDAIQRYTAIIFVDKHGGPDASSSNATAALGSRKSTLSSLQVIVADNSAELGPASTLA